MTVFLSDLKASHEQSKPVAIETNTMHHRGTVTTISEEGGYIILRAPKGFSETVKASTILMADIVSVQLNG